MARSAGRQKRRFKDCRKPSKAENSEKSELFSGEVISEHLERIADELKAAEEHSEGELRSVLAKVFRGLNELKDKNYSAEQLERKIGETGRVD